MFFHFQPHIAEGIAQFDSSLLSRFCLPESEAESVSANTRFDGCPSGDRMSILPGVEASQIPRMKCSLDDSWRARKVYRVWSLSNHIQLQMRDQENYFCTLWSYFSLIFFVIFIYYCEKPSIRWIGV
jgi:hypothetical protein